MILFDFKCPECNHMFEELVKSGTAEAPCPKCEATAQKALVNPPRIDMLSMGSQHNATDSAIDYFDRIHRQQTKIEEAHEREHGDYGRAPGS